MSDDLVSGRDHVPHGEERLLVLGDGGHIPDQDPVPLRHHKQPGHLLHQVRHGSGREDHGGVVHAHQQHRAGQITVGLR